MKLKIMFINEWQSSPPLQFIHKILIAMINAILKSIHAQSTCESVVRLVHNMAQGLVLHLRQMNATH